jgi:16S rRNA processing protein RimM
MATDGPPVVTIGKILATHGVEGAVKVQSYSDVPDRFENLKQVIVEGSLARRTLTVESVRRVPQGYLLSFDTINTSEAAASLIGNFLLIPEERLAPLSDDRYYEYQLVGMEVRTEDGTYVGMLKEVLTTKGNAVFVVEPLEGGEHLIPATKEIVRVVDLDGQRMVIRRVPGLLDETHAV